VSIHPLPQFEKDLEEYLAEKADREAYERLNAPTRIVVRFGFTKMVGEFPYQGDAKPGCGSKIVVRTHRGTELGEMLTSTCPNAGCAKSVTRKEMLEYIKNSGGRKYPFFERGEALRIATKEDMDAQSRIEQQRHGLRTRVKGIVANSGLDMELVDVEEILGAERTTVYYTAPERVDFRALLVDLQHELSTKIELTQVGARDEARITADYERCGQYCCCKNFLKVLKPVSMRSAKVQKATLDPLKISGRCGRLMCCLRYEDETYEELRRRLPNRKKRVGTPDGDGIVLDTQILTQLVKVRLDSGTDVAVTVEELTDPEHERAPERPPPRERPRRDRAKDRAPDQTRDKGSERGPEKDRESERGSGGAPSKKKRRRRRTRPQDGEAGGAPTPPEGQGDPERPSERPEGSSSEGRPRKKRRRRRRRRDSDGGPGGDQSGGQGGGPNPGPDSE